VDEEGGSADEGATFNGFNVTHFSLFV